MPGSQLTAFALVRNVKMERVLLEIWEGGDPL